MGAWILAAIAARASWVAESCSGTFLSTMSQPPTNVLHDESLSVDMLSLNQEPTWKQIALTKQQIDRLMKNH